jgi:hypothetical protein
MPWRGREGNVKIDLKEIEFEDVVRIQWRTVVNTVIKLWVP